jgi:hypothetical protein
MAPRMRAPALAFALASAFLLAGCTAEGAGSSNFDLRPTRVGWFAGDEATFTLSVGSSLLNGAPNFTIDRRFAIERIDLTEQGIRFGGNYETKDPDAVGLVLSRGGNASDEFTLDEQNPTIDVALTLPADLRDSEYALELKLFKVGWVKSEKFRVDRR